MIDPNVVTTVRVGELPPATVNLTDKIPHEIDTELFSGTVKQLADTIGGYLGSLGGLSFNPTTISDGGTLPVTTVNEWMLVGKGTFHNVGGQPDIITTEELNALTSNGSYWSLAVEIPINVELAGITQNIRSGHTETTPSENTVFNALALKANISDVVSPIKLSFTNFGRLIADQQNFTIPIGATAIFAIVNGGNYILETPESIDELDTFTQSAVTVSFKNTLVIGNNPIIFYKQ